MIVDKEEHKQMLLELIKHTTFPGDFIDKVYELKKSIEKSEVKE